MSRSQKSKESKKKLGISKHNAYEWVMTTALSVRDEGHPIIVRQAKVAGEHGLLVFIPGYKMEGGELKAIEMEAQPA